MCDKSAYREAPPQQKEHSFCYKPHCKDRCICNPIYPPRCGFGCGSCNCPYCLDVLPDAPPQTPAELLAKSAMVKKKVDADRLEERKKQGEYMSLIKETM
jgi:hypothetical protein